MKFQFVVFLLLLFLIILQPTANAQVTRQDLWLEMDDGVKLDVTKFIPSGQQPQGGFPAIIFVHGLGGSKQRMFNNARDYAQNGFVTVTYSVRGQGNSEGLSTVFSYREQKDLDNIINWLIIYIQVNAEKIGVSGGSQGGFHSWFAAVNGMKVKAVAPENSIPQRVDAAARYGCYSTAITSEIEYNQTVRLDTAAFPLKKWLLADNYDSVRAVVNRGRYFDATDIAASSANYLMMGAWHDHVFPHNRMPEAFTASSMPSFIYLGTGGHGSESSSDESNFRRELKRKFFCEILKEEYCGLDTLKPVIMALGPDWNHYEFDEFPPPEQKYKSFYLHSNGTLSLNKPGCCDSLAQIQNQLLDPTYTWADAVEEKFNNTRSKFLIERQTWKTEPLSDTLKILGIPKAEVYAKSANSKFQINFQLYAESPSGEVTYLSQISLGKRENPDTTSWHKMTGEFVIVGWEIPSGYRLRIDWASINQTLDDTSLWTVPYWDADGKISLGLNTQHPTSISIPVLNLGSTDVSDEKMGNYNNKIEGFQLYQNYPNPFNSTTNIRFRISDCELGNSQYISLKVFDILGRKIETLMDGEINVGNHSIVFNAKILPSGLYFVRLTNQAYSQSRKMEVIK